MSIRCRIAKDILSRRASGSLAVRSTRWVPPLAMTTATSTRLGLVPGGVATRGLASLSGGSILTNLATENPYKDVVRYEFKNRKWNLQHVEFYSEALAIGLLENGLQPGDVVLSWLPAHFSESVRHVVLENCVCGLLSLDCAPNDYKLD